MLLLRICGLLGVHNVVLRRVVEASAVGKAKPVAYAWHLSMPHIAGAASVRLIVDIHMRWCEARQARPWWRWRNGAVLLWSLSRGRLWPVTLRIWTLLLPFSISRTRH